MNVIFEQKKYDWCCTVCIRDLDKLNLIYAVWIRDLDKLNLIWWFDFILNPIFPSAPAASTNTPHFKSGQKWPKNNPHRYLTKVKYKSPIHALVWENCTSMRDGKDEKQVFLTLIFLETFNSIRI